MAVSNVSFSKTPQAVDDSFSVTSSGPVLLDVMANDRGGKAKKLYSIDDAGGGDQDTNSTNDLLDKDAPGVVEQTALGGSIAITDGKVQYTAPSFAQYLDDGQNFVDSFGYAIQMGNGTISTATVKVNLSGSRDLGFEDGGFISGGWEITGQVGVVTSDITGGNPSPNPDAGGATVNPTEGGYFAKLLAGTTPNNAVEDFLGVGNTAIDSLTGSPTDASAIKTKLYLKTGDTVSFDWFFDERDGQIGIFNDTAFFTTLDGTLTELADSTTVNTDGTGWQTFSFVVGSDIGLVDFGIGIANGLDTALDSALYIDNLRVVSI